MVNSIYDYVLTNLTYLYKRNLTDIRHLILQWKVDRGKKSYKLFHCALILLLAAGKCADRVIILLFCWLSSLISIQ